MTEQRARCSVNDLHFKAQAHFYNDTKNGKENQQDFISGVGRYK